METEYTVMATKALPDERGSPGYAGSNYHRATSLLYPAEVRARFETDRVYTSDELRLFNRAWQRFRTGQ